MAKRYSGSYATHLGPLIACMNKTKGDVLELGVGLFSTPYLHYVCTVTKRNLLSLENDKGWLKTFKTSDFMHFLYENDYHHLEYIEDYTKNPIILKKWDVVLIDHSPDSQRALDAIKLAGLAQYIIIHDSNERHEDKYHYSTVYPFFKYKRVWDLDDRHATVLSNFNNLDDLW